MTTSESSKAITIVKQNAQGKKVLEYTGEVVARGATWVCVRATFENPDKVRDYVTFRHGDTFIEWHYSDRWYNVFELLDVGDGHLKGWYCNITHPARLTQEAIYADDLALDVFVSPERKITVLDEDEFEELQLSEQEQQSAWAAVEQIRQAVACDEAPFTPR